MKSQLINLLQEKKCFKLILGAGNEDICHIEKLVALYSDAGCRFFDLCAKKEAIDAAKKALERSNKLNESFLCVSVGLKGDPHISKAKYEKEKCCSCRKCESVCPQKAILFEDETPFFNSKKCIGCSRCEAVCPNGAIYMTSKEPDLEEILPPLVEEGIDCIEFHASSEDDCAIEKKWEQINRLYKGILSICVDRAKLSNSKIVSRISKMIEKRAPYTTIVQADGAPMSGGKDDFKTTLQAVATAEIIQNAKLPVFVLMSGGTNSKTAKLAKMCGINFNGVAIGSFARKIVSEYVEREDFFENQEIYREALSVAKELIKAAYGSI